MARTSGLLCAGLAAAALALGFGQGGWWIWVGATGILGALWLLSQRRNWEWMASVGLIGSVCLAAIGLLLGLEAGWMVTGLVAALCAWDLHRFVVRLRTAGRVEAQSTLEQRHLLRLLAIAGLSLLAAVLALRLEIRLGFVMALLLGLLAGWGLSRAVGFLRSQSD